MKQARFKARLSRTALGGLAGVSADTVDRAERGDPIQELKAYAIVEALNSRLPEDQHVKMEDIAVYKKGSRKG